jgi:flagellar biosynthesis/type III secretory pathway chaperone
VLVSGAEEPALGEAGWRQRALAAEARADNAAAMLRSHLLPHLARWMTGEGVRRLLSHRSALLMERRRAEQEVADLARRLEQVHAPIEERLRAYEKRIAELENELADKGAQNAELIKAKIESTRKKLAVERGQQPASWN